MAERFWSRVNGADPSGCWLWTGYVQKNGYGKFTVGETGKCWLAHRLAWYLTYGSEPEQELDHTCRVRACVNPSHLEDVSRVENDRRKPAASRWRKPASYATHCRNGHAFTPENTYLPPSGGRRQCNECRYRVQVRRGKARRLLSRLPRQEA